MGASPLLVALLLCATGASGAAFYPMSSYTDHRFSWSLPEDARDTTGLGGGIAYALDPKLCEELMPTFKEERPEMIERAAVGLEPSRGRMGTPTGVRDWAGG